VCFPRKFFNIELLVTGETTDDPVPKGIIIGMPREFVKFNEQKRRQIASAITLLILIIVGIVFVILDFLPSLKEINRSVVPGIWALSLILLTAFNLLWPQGISRQRIPRDLRT
jgi:FlaA1/EpsC-like NDP-sugar epimerase